jgi:hypothetical protein
MTLKPDDEIRVDLAVALGVTVAAMLVSGLFWWPLVLVSWHYWMG